MLFRRQLSCCSVHPGATEVCNGIDDNCNSLVDDGITFNNYYADADHDNYGSTLLGSFCSAPSNSSLVSGDCNDNNANVHPGATEVCNGIDDNCTGGIDEGVQSTFYADADGDTYGNASVTTMACNAPSGYVSDNTDCDDAHASVHPGATEVCNGIDDNCTGGIDEGVLSTFYRDADGDAYGNASVTAQACSAPSGYVADATDCDDAHAGVHPGAAETCNGIDDNCNSLVDDGVTFNNYYADADGDNYGSTLLGSFCSAPSNSSLVSGDCNDNNASVHPGATEVCNGIDDNCTGGIDEGVQSTFYADADGDTYGNASVTTMACNAPSGYVSDNTDCDDAHASVHPGATEVCNGIDDNCTGGIDEGVLSTFYRDADGDAYGNASVTAQACSAPSGYVADATDCDDAHSSVHPGATEVCNGIDDNCNSLVDDGVTFNNYYADADGDNYGSTLLGSFCSAPSNSSLVSGDCNDNNASVHPGATEVCNGIDDNCTGGIDEGVQSTFYADADGDTYGNASVTTMACNAPSGYVSDNTDCDDAHASVHPGATEVCNGIDDNCTGGIDEGVLSTFYRDADGDAYGNASVTAQACSAPSGYVADATDCDDAHAGVHPGAAETCNGIDDNCNSLVDDGVTFNNYYADADGDNYGSTLLGSFCSAPSNSSLVSGDCNDNNASVHPGATEVCNGIDDNCTGGIDEGVQSTFYADADGDTYGNASVTTMACNAPSGYVSDNTDCDDAHASVHPGATEVCNGIDDNCTGGIDEGVLSTFYRDADGDAYGNASVTAQACSAPSGYVADATDCDDAHSSVHPGATEVCNGIDDNCNSLVDDGVTFNNYYADADGDNYGSTLLGSFCSAPSNSSLVSGDCNDNNASVHPGATEVCNGIDDNCTGGIDEGVQSTFYADADGDTYGNASVTTMACNAPSGYVSDNTDCDDAHASVHPGATEVCNGIDDNCTGGIDEGVLSTFYRDADGDAYGNASVTAQACSAPSGYVADATDCDDAHAGVHPGAAETCNGIDDNCNSLVDDGVTFNNYYADADGDNYGSTLLGSFCSAPSNSSLVSGDCNDNNASVHPGATEVCNGIDDNCTGGIDEGVQSTFYADADGDTYGNASVTTMACNAPSGYVSDNTDCDDAHASVHPGATEVCNGIDDNCTGGIDEGVLSTFYRDADGDAYGNASVTAQACSAPSGYVADATDCDDAHSSVHPGAAETCNGIDDNCNSLVNDGVTFNNYYADADHDNYGSTLLGSFCSAPSNSSLVSGDCNDNNANVHPGATEVCNGIDDNCTGGIDEGVQSTFYADADGDTYGNASVTTMACNAPSGYVSDNTDCDDAHASVHPGATEVCNGIDDNCTGGIDEGVLSTFYRDADGDAYGNASVTAQACSAPSGYVADATDCDDAHSSVHPGATEVCNGIDDNCNSLVDEGITFKNYYADADHDNYGSTLLGSFCSAPSNSSLVSGDCNDNNANVHPGATEVCNGIDDNCTGGIDEGVQSTFYADADGDTYGNASVTTMACSAPSGYVADATDCDDVHSSVHPGTTDICNGIDDNCTGGIDEGVLS